MVTPASIFLLLPDGSPEESFASVAGSRSVVFSGGAIAANGAADHEPVVANQRLAVEQVTEIKVYH
jgi:hypothetical protein